MERSAVLLKIGGLSVTQIALDAGYESHDAFYRSFKAGYGISSSQFRRDRAFSTASFAPSGLHDVEGKTPSSFRTIRSGGQVMDVKIRQIAPVRAAFMRHGEPCSECGPVWDRLLASMGQEGIAVCGLACLLFPSSKSLK